MKKAFPAIYQYKKEEYVLLRELADMKDISPFTAWEMYREGLSLPGIKELKWVDDNNELHVIPPPDPINLDEPIYILASVVHWILEKRDDLWRAAAIRIKSSY